MLDAIVTVYTKSLFFTRCIYILELNSFVSVGVFERKNFNLSRKYNMFDKFKKNKAIVKTNQENIKRVLRYIVLE